MGRRARGDVPDVILRQLRRRQWTRRGVVTTLILLASSAIADRFGLFKYRGDDWRKFDKQAVVVTHVSDGDTVHIRIPSNGAEDIVRLRGIDAPEIAHQRGQTDAHWGREATDYLKERVDGKTVTLRLDSTETRDKYRRLLAYVYLNDAENVNIEMIRLGHVYAHRMFPHSMQRQFEQAEDEARGKSRGLWKDLEEEQMPAWRRDWLAKKRNGG